MAKTVDTSGGWDPHWYLHPSLTIYLITFLVQLARPFYLLIHGHSLLQDLPAGDEFYDFVSPPEVIVAGRCVVLAASLGIVVVGMVLARRIAGHRAALAAGALLASCPALLQRGVVVIVDTVAAFCVLATLLWAHRLHAAVSEGEATASTGYRDALVAGLFAGASAAAKYPAGLVFLVVVLALLGPWSRWKAASKRLAFATAGAFAGACLGTPAFVLRPGAVVRALREQSRLYATPALFGSWGGPGVFRQALSPEELGVAACLLGACGCLALAWRRSTRPWALAWLGFGVLLVVPLVLSSFQPFRYVLPLVPPFLIAGAVLLFPERASARSGRDALGGLGLAVVLLTFVPGWTWTYRERGVRDSRRDFVDWLVTRVRPGQRLLVTRELAFLPAELARIPATVVVAPSVEARALAESGTFDDVVYGRFDLGWALPGDTRREELARFDGWSQSLRAEARFGFAPTPIYPNFWRTNHELILVSRPGG